MTAQNRSTLKAVFETGDVPDGANYADLIDSSFNLVDTSAQAVASPVTFAASVAFTGLLSLDSLSVSAAATVGSMAVLGALSVSGAATVGSVGVLGAMRVSANTSVGGALVVGSSVTAGSMGILGALRVSAATSLEGAVALGGALTVVTAQTTATASGAVGGSTVPATATKYLKVVVSGVTYNVALYPSV